MSRTSRPTYLLALSIEPTAFLTERFPACSRTPVFGFDVVSSVAFGIVVVDELLNRMPRCFSHLYHLPVELRRPPQTNRGTAGRMVAIPQATKIRYILALSQVVR